MSGSNSRVRLPSGLVIPAGPLRGPTAVVDGNVNGPALRKAVVRRRVVTVIGLGGNLGGLAEGAAEEADGVALGGGKHAQTVEVALMRALVKH
ncbi:hypothetical protein V2S66_33525 [Streptomyces sp. V4-01]|uniref:Uncharacterized protein n=1 Tax=Actinacidiphila polyblastidii TaxID=3110430 RepID=A0ABU7PNR3_9ACTN|nr:hypothetical protein [Streptomyces sp. V4-01]